MAMPVVVHGAVPRPPDTTTTLRHTVTMSLPRKPSDCHAHVAAGWAPLTNKVRAAFGTLTSCFSFKVRREALTNLFLRRANEIGLPAVEEVPKPRPIAAATVMGIPSAEKGFAAMLPGQRAKATTVDLEAAF